ncbi:MAG: hypothetical protein NTY05_06645 [Rhodocyclales bacterium]|nr:hypothetical protein [Rhodocyclales bacterium]
MRRRLIPVLLFALCGCQTYQEIRNPPPLARPDLDRPKPLVAMGTALPVSKSPYVQAAAIGPDGKAHLLVTGRVETGWSTCDIGTITHVVVGPSGTEHEEVLYEKPPCAQPNWRLGGYVYDLAFDSAGRLHAIASDKNFVREGGRWREDGSDPCERYSHGSGELACAFTIGAKDIGVSTVGKQIAGWFLFAFLTVGRAHYGDMWDDNRPRRIAVARMGEQGWGNITVLEADDIDSGDMVGRDATVFTDAQNRVRVLYKGRIIDDLAAATKGEGQLNRTSADGKEIALPMRKASGRKVEGLVAGIASNISSFTPRFAIDPPSGRMLGLLHRKAEKQRAEQLGRRLGVGVVESQLASSGGFASPQEVFFGSGLLSLPSPVSAPGGRFQFAIPVITATPSGSCSYEVRYYLWQDERWSAPLLLEADIKKNQDCWRLAPYQALPPLSPQIASDARGRSFVAWSSGNGVAGRWLEFQAETAR